MFLFKVLYHSICRKFVALLVILFSFHQACTAATEDRIVGEEKAIRATMFPATSMPDRDWWQDLWPNPKDVLSTLMIDSNMSVVDLCCGDGYFTIPLAEMVTKVYGIELDGNLLEQAQRDASINSVQNCRWIQGDAMNLSNLVPELVDYVFLANTFHGNPDKEELVRSVASILKPGGQFAIVNWHQRPREETIVLGLPRGPKTEMRMSPDQVNDIILPLGFDLKSVVDVSPYHYGSVFTKHKDTSTSIFSITEIDREQLIHIEKKNPSEFHILCLCAGNATRSQLAEGWLKHISGGDSIKIMSAAAVDSRPVNLKAVQVMEESGLLIHNPLSKQLTTDMLEWADLVITTCSPSDESCPVLPRGTAKLHWLIETSAKKPTSEEELILQTRSMSKIVQHHALVLLNVLKDINQI